MSDIFATRNKISLQSAVQKYLSLFWNQLWIRPQLAHSTSQLVLLGTVQN